jgi:hypothetical protein
MNTKDNEEYVTFLSELESEDGDEIRDMILEQACDTAQVLTELDCERQEMLCYDVEMEGETEVSTYTKEAQRIFDVYYDEQTEQLNRLLYRQMKILFDE